MSKNEPALVNRISPQEKVKVESFGVNDFITALNVFGDVEHDTVCMS